MRRIRSLEKRDAARMLACLNDKENIRYLTLAAKQWSIHDCFAFIERAKIDNCNKHFAIVDDADSWIGTISLKRIDGANKKAEYAIIMDAASHGRGFALEATKELFDYAFGEAGLNKIYLNVISENRRAIAFYLKCGFSLIGESHESLFFGGRYFDLQWFELLKGDYEKS